MTIIVCPICGEPCGRQYPDTHEEPGFREGKGENFADLEGNWYCCQECLDTYEEAVSAIERESSVRINWPC